MASTPSGSSPTLSPAADEILQYHYKVLATISWYNFSNGVTGGDQRQFDDYAFTRNGKALPQFRRNGFGCTGLIEFKS